LRLNILHLTTLKFIIDKKRNQTSLGRAKKMTTSTIHYLSFPLKAFGGQGLPQSFSTRTELRTYLKENYPQLLGCTATNSKMLNDQAVFWLPLQEITHRFSVLI